MAVAAERRVTENYHLQVTVGCWSRRAGPGRARPGPPSTDISTGAGGKENKSTNWELMRSLSEGRGVGGAGGRGGGGATEALIAYLKVSGIFLYSEELFPPSSLPLVLLFRVTWSPRVRLTELCLSSQGLLHFV